MRTILCFGDSNTWGFDIETWLATGRNVPRRFPPSARWPRVLAATLGDDFEVIEEGLNGRTTVFDDAVEGKHRNGSRYLLACLESHAPLDLLVLMLGTNDLKTRFSSTAGDIAAGAASLARIALASGTGQNGAAPKVLLVAPFPLGENIEKSPFGEMFSFKRGVGESRFLADRYRVEAERLETGFLDAGSVVKAHPLDCIHLGADDQKKLGLAIAAKVKEMLGA